MWHVTTIVIIPNSWWRHQRETFSALLAICAGNSLVTGEFPTQRPVTQSFDVFFDVRPNKRLSKQSWDWWFETPSRSLWCHCNADVVRKYYRPSVRWGILTDGFTAQMEPSNAERDNWCSLQTGISNILWCSLIQISPSYRWVECEGRNSSSELIFAIDI